MTGCIGKCEEISAEMVTPWGHFALFRAVFSPGPSSIEPSYSRGHTQGSLNQFSPTQVSKWS